MYSLTISKRPQKEDLILPIEGGKIDLSGVADNICSIFLSKVLLQKRLDKGFIEGNDWKILPKKNTKPLKRLRRNSPFAGLNGLFDEE